MITRSCAIRVKFIVCICFLDVELDLVLSFGKEVRLLLRIVFEYLAYFSGSMASQSDCLILKLRYMAKLKNYMFLLHEQTRFLQGKTTSTTTTNLYLILFLLFSLYKRSSAGPLDTQTEF